MCFAWLVHSVLHQSCGIQGQPTGADDPHVKTGSDIDAFDGAPGQEEAEEGAVNGVHDINREGIQSSIEGFQVCKSTRKLHRGHRFDNGLNADKHWSCFDSGLCSW